MIRSSLVRKRNIPPVGEVVPVIKMEDATVSDSPECITFTTTAMARPEILRRTYTSFSTKITGLTLSNKHLFLNVDPLPNLSVEANRALQEETVAVAREFFAQVTANLPEKADFGTAVKWVWSNLKTPYTFHLEDDWELLFDVDFNAMVNKIRGCHQVCLRAYDHKRRTKHGYMVSLSPSLWKTRFCTRSSGIIVPGENPEGLLKKKSRTGITLGYNNHTAGVYPNTIVLKDIGREWMEQRGYSKIGGNFFTSWK